MQHTYQHDWKPSHPPKSDAVIQAEEEAAWAWKKLDDHSEERTPGMDHYQPEWYEQYHKLWCATLEAAGRVLILRHQALNCTCDPDPNRQSATCPACRAVMDNDEVLPF